MKNTIKITTKFPDARSTSQKGIKYTNIFLSDPPKFSQIGNFGLKI
jgi:hypothetical protein